MDVSGAPSDGLVVAGRMSFRRVSLTKGRLCRNRLDLEDRHGCKALIFCAPRGYGKSVQVALCANAALQRGEHCIYLDLSSPRRRGLSEAETIADGIVCALTPTVRTGIVGEANLVAQALSAFDDANRVTICLDGVGDEGQCGGLLEALLLETPATVRLVIAGRGPTDLTALSLLPDVETVGPAELAFDRSEAVRFAGGDVTVAEAMLAATGGWPALCAFMQRAGPANAPLESRPEIHAFFRDEILLPLETPLQEILLNASMLEEITPDAYDYVFKTRDTAGALIQRASEFGLVAPVGESRYELNPVLRRYLRARFAAEKGNRRSSVLKRVGLWHWRRGEFREMITAALDAHDHRWAPHLSEEVILDLALRQGEIETLCKLVGEIPKSRLFKRQALAVSYAWALYFNQRAHAADEILTALVQQETSRNTSSGDSASHGALVRAIGKATHDEMILSEQLCKDWLRDYGTSNALGKGAAFACLAFIAASDRRFSSLDPLVQSAISASRLVRHRYAFGWIAATRIQAELLRGDVVAAREALIEARESTDVAIDRTPFIHGMLEALALQIDMEDISVDLCEERLRKVVAFAMDFGVTDIVWSTIRCSAETLVQRDNQAQAFSLIAECGALAHQRGLKRLGMLAQLGAAGVALASNVEVMDDVLQKPADLSFLPNQNRAIQGEIELLRAMRCLREKKAGLADHHARKALSAFAAVADLRGQIRAMYVLAAALVLLQEETSACRYVADADLLVRQLGCFGTLRNTRALMLPVCPSATTFLDQVSSLNPVSVGTTKLRPLNTPRADGTSGRLTSKQLGILEYASEGLTNKEIAKRLYVTEDAVKWHFRKIFHLLSVTTRTQAVAEAHERGLL